MASTDQPSAIRIFVSHAHRDRDLFQQFLLATEAARGGATTWYDLEIKPGDTWDPMILHSLDVSDLILLLLSENFLASRFCISVEMRRALALHRNRSARVVPVLLSPCDWQTSPLAQIQGIPSGMRPVTDWPSPEEAWGDVADHLRRITEELSEEVRNTQSAANSYNELADFTDAQLLRMIEGVRFSINLATENIADFPPGSEPLNRLIELGKLKRRLVDYEREFRGRTRI